jgi:hypothetical protein
MGRGLSELQKTILVMAHQKRIDGRTGGAGRGAELYYAEILAAVHGWTPAHGSLHYQREMTSRFGTISVGDYHYGTHFSKWHIGKQYNAAMASLSRAVLRLNKRGLITAWRGRSWAGVCLTDAGAEIAQQLSANTAENLPPD